MGTIFHYQTVSKIEVQVDSNNAFFTIDLMEQENERKCSFKLTHSELNKLLGTIQYLNPDYDLMASFTTQQPHDNLSILELDFCEQNWNHTWVSDYIYSDNYKKIRA